MAFGPIVGGAERGIAGALARSAAKSEARSAARAESRAFSKAAKRDGRAGESERGKGKSRGRDEDSDSQSNRNRNKESEGRGRGGSAGGMDMDGFMDDARANAADTSVEYAADNAMEKPANEGQKSVLENCIDAWVDYAIECLKEGKPVDQFEVEELTENKEAIIIILAEFVEDCNGSNEEEMENETEEFDG